MDSVFSINTEAKKSYETSIKASKASNIFGWTAIASLFGGVIIMNSNDCQNCSTFGHAFLGSLISVFGTSICGTIGVLTRIRANKFKKQAISVHNSDYSSSSLTKNETLFSFGMQKYGIGVAITF